MKQLARDLVSGLKGHPLALALVAVNLIYVAAGLVYLRDEHRRYANAIRALIQDCLSERSN